MTPLKMAQHIAEKAKAIDDMAGGRDDFGTQAYADRHRKWPEAWGAYQKACAPQIATTIARALIESEQKLAAAQAALVKATDVPCSSRSCDRVGFTCTVCRHEGPPGDRNKAAHERAIANGREAFDAALAQAREDALNGPWSDTPDEHTPAITAAFPTRSGSHAEFAQAMQMVGNRQSKGALVALVNWLLVREVDAVRVVRAREEMRDRCVAFLREQQNIAKINGQHVITHDEAIEYPAVENELRECADAIAALPTTGGES